MAFVTCQCGTTYPGNVLPADCQFCLAYQHQQQCQTEWAQHQWNSQMCHSRIQGHQEGRQGMAHEMEGMKKAWEANEEDKCKKAEEKEEERAKEVANLTEEVKGSKEAYASLEKEKQRVKEKDERKIGNQRGEIKRLMAQVKELRSKVDDKKKRKEFQEIGDRKAALKLQAGTITRQGEELTALRARVSSLRATVEQQEAKEKQRSLASRKQAKAAKKQTTTTTTKKKGTPTTGWDCLVDLKQEEVKVAQNEAKELHEQCEMLQKNNADLAETCRSMRGEVLSLQAVVAADEDKVQLIAKGTQIADLERQKIKDKGMLVRMGEVLSNMRDKLVETKKAIMAAAKAQRALQLELIEATKRPIMSVKMLQTMRIQCPILAHINDGQFQEILMCCPTIEKFSNLLALLNKIMQRFHGEIKSGKIPAEIPFLVPTIVDGSSMIHRMAMEHTIKLLASVRHSRNSALRLDRDDPAWSKKNTITMVEGMLQTHRMPCEGGKSICVQMKSSAIWKEMLKTGDSKFENDDEEELLLPVGITITQ